CRVFQKSAGGKKYPSNNSRVVVNTYNLEIGPSSLMHVQMMPPAEPCQFWVGRNYTCNADVAEMSRVFTDNTIGFNFLDPIPSQLPGSWWLLHYFRIEIETWPSNSAQQIFRPATPPSRFSVVNQQDASFVMFTATSAFAGEALYGAELNNGNVLANRFMHRDHCLELDNYWPPY
ncbi:hypothetical protein U1Q18_036365, partial [Sarracenia purpurea var. burkii]